MSTINKLDSLNANVAHESVPIMALRKCLTSVFAFVHNAITTDKWLSHARRVSVKTLAARRDPLLTVFAAFPSIKSSIRFAALEVLQRMKPGIRLEYGRTEPLRHKFGTHKT